MDGYQPIVGHNRPRQAADIPIATLRSRLSASLALRLVCSIARHMPTLGVFAAITDTEHRILCVRMNYATGGWTTPGGRVEAGESPLEALKREVFEEAALEVIAESLVGVYCKPHKDDIVLFVRARVIAYHPWQPNGEIAQLGYFGRASLPEPMGLGARTRIIDALDGIKGIVRIIPEEADQRPASSRQLKSVKKDASSDE
jgi:8-oxo-dGTP diphosphatase